MLTSVSRRMRTRDLLVLRCFLCLIPLAFVATQTVPCNIHGYWEQFRSLRGTYHISCDYEVSEPINHFTVSLKTAVNHAVVQTWSMLEASSSDYSILYSSKSSMYPPRMSLHFHVSSRRLDDLNCTCELTVLSQPFFMIQAKDKNKGMLWTMDGREGTTAFTRSTWSSTWGSTGSTGQSTIPPCQKLDSVFPVQIEKNLTEPDPYESTLSPPTSATDLMPSLLLPGRGELTLGRRRKKRTLFDTSGGFAGGLNLPDLVMYNYTDAISKSMKFYEAQRSGDFVSIPADEPHQWVRPSGLYHVAPDGRDLSGGWYNGNDNVKLSFPMAAATTVLAWGFQTWQGTYIKHGMDQKMKEVLKWPLDYFLKSWKADTETLYVHVGDLSLERALFQRPDDLMYFSLWTSGQWPVYSVNPTNPGSDVAAEIASAMAIASQLNIGDAEYSATLLETAQQLYKFAKKYLGKYSDHVPVGGQGYPDYTSLGYQDELCLTGAILYQMTSKDSYLRQAKNFFDEISDDIPKVFSWNQKHIACALKLYDITGLPKYKTPIQDFQKHWLTFDTVTTSGFPWTTDEGTLRHTANAAFILLQSAESFVFDAVNEMLVYSWCAKQLHYILGNNNMMRSYQIGYKNEKNIKNPYHKNSACPSPPFQCGMGFYNSDNTNVNRLVGALVGGPDRNDYHDDSRQNTLGNSVAVDYNAGFQSALAGIQHVHEKLTISCENHATAMSTQTTPFFTDYTTTATTPSPFISETPYTSPLPTPVPAKPESFDYGDALRKSLLFYAAQRASESEPFNNPITWRRWGVNLFQNDGGWYDDGSSIKTTKLMAGSVTIIGWGMIAFKKGYELSGTLDDAYNSIQSPLNSLRLILSDDGNGLTVKLGEEPAERGIWARPTDKYIVNIPHSIKTLNVDVDEMGADVAADAATALAVGSVLYSERNITFSQELRSKAEQLYSTAKQFTQTYKDATSTYYSDPGESFEDELCVAAWWMFKATQDISFYQDGMKYQNTKMSSNVLDWRDKHSLCLLLTYEQTGDSRLSFLLVSAMSYWEGSSNGVHYTPQGLAWHDTEPLKYAANAAFVQALAGTFGISTITGVNEFGKKQIDYMLGNNDRAYSYQIGYGSRFPLRAHHRASSCPDYMFLCDWSVYNRPGANPHELTGALVAGPDQNDVFEDVRSNYTMTRVSIEANAGFQSMLAYLVQTYDVTTTSSTTDRTTTKPIQNVITQKPKTTTTTQKVPTTTKAKTTKAPRTKPPKTTTKRPTDVPKTSDTVLPVVTKQPETPTNADEVNENLENEELTSNASVVEKSFSIVFSLITTWLLMYIKIYVN